VVHYEPGICPPAPGDVVPCRRHGYCATAAVPVPTRGARGPRRTRSPRRTQEELRARLGGLPGESLAALRRERFTLRLLADAQQEGWLRVDQESDWVRLRSLP